MVRTLLILVTLYIGYTIYRRIYARSCPACGQHMKREATVCPNCRRPQHADEAIEATILDADRAPMKEADGLFSSPLVVTLIVLTLLAVAAVAFFVHVVGKA